MKKKILKPKIPKPRAKLPFGCHGNMGYLVNSRWGQKWIPDPEWVVPGSFKVRKPAFGWPRGDSYKKHVYTTKYLKLLLEHRPDLYSKMVNKLPKHIPDEQFNQYHKEVGKKINIDDELKRCKNKDIEREKLLKKIYRRT